MNLKFFTIGVIISICYIFFSRILGTIYMPFNLNQELVLTRLVLNFFANLTIIFFFVNFIKEYVPDDEYPLLNSSVSVIIGSLALLIINFINGLYPFLPATIYNSTSGRYLTNLIDWVYAFLIVIFFLFFYLHARKCSNFSLIKPIKWVLAGSTAIFLMRSINFLNYFYYFQNNGKFLDIQKGAFVIIGTIIILLGFASMIYFLLSFFHYQISISHENE